VRGVWETVPAAAVGFQSVLERVPTACLSRTIKRNAGVTARGAPDGVAAVRGANFKGEERVIQSATGGRELAEHFSDETIIS
jgi:hypothetical protein